MIKSWGLPTETAATIVTPAMSDPITDVRDISKLGYGFIVSKALFAALDLDLFSRLSGNPASLSELAAAADIAENRLATLLTVLVSVGLLAKQDDRYANAPACESYLVRGAPLYYGDYFRHQIARQIYPLLLTLDAALAGTGSVGGAESYEAWLETSEQAELFSRSQHVGSLGPASVLARQAELAGRRTLLDVAGGTGAFAIALCRANPELCATILDFPKVAALARDYVAAAGLETRIATLGGNALATGWPGGQDAVLMSYLQSAVAGDQIDELNARAFAALEPGGLMLVHDFMAEDDLTGPVVAASFMLVSLSFDPGTLCLTPGLVGEKLVAQGFVNVATRDLIPGITKLTSAVKPA